MAHDAEPHGEVLGSEAGVKKNDPEPLLWFLQEEMSEAG